MPLSQELQRLYSSAPDNSVIHDAIVLSCSAWSEDVACITATIQDTVKNYPAGNPRTFIPAKFGLSKSRSDDSGVVEISIELDVTAALYTLLEKAEAIQSKITATFLVYTEADADPAAPPLVLTLDAVTVTETKVSFNARNSGLIDRAFPYRTATAAEYPGLSR